MIRIVSCFSRIFMLIVCFSLLNRNGFAQKSAMYSYQHLSHIVYVRQSDSIKKAWLCPSLYKEKETQKKFKEIWESRTSFIVEAIESKTFLKDQIVYDFVNSVVTEIIKANPQYFSASPTLLIDRSGAVNAYAVGKNLIAVNAGLVNFANSKEELALVIAHELSHNHLQHADNAMKEKAEWLTSDEYKESLNAVLDSKYERFSRLKKMMASYKFSSSRHNRYHESEADSMALVLLKNARIGFNARFFLRLDSADNIFKTPLTKKVSEHIAAMDITLDNAWLQKKSRGLSTKSFHFKETASLADSLKTHPDCEERYNNTLRYSTTDFKETPIAKAVKENANKVVIWNSFKNQALTACLYRVLLEKDKGNTDAWLDFMAYNALNQLYYADRKLNRFNAINVAQKELISEDYYQLQNLLEQIPREQLEQICKKLQQASFWNAMSSDAKELKLFYSLINFDETASDKAIGKFAKNFITNYPNSPYIELMENFTK
jgi:hypothetical protein